MFVCYSDGCQKTYESRYSLKRHFELKHCKTKRFRCRVCSKCLSSKQSMQEHSYTHSKAKPYVCSVASCGLTFRQKSLLSIHKKVHDNVRNLPSLNEFQEIKLTCLLKKDAKNDPSDTQINIESGLELPLITGNQVGVTLPSLITLE